MRRMRNSILGLTLVMCVGSGTAAFACSAPDGQVRQFSAKTGSLVNAILVDPNGKNDLDRITYLRDLLSENSLNAYEAATISQMLGAAYYELNDYDRAIEAFEMAIDACGLLPKEVSNLQVNIAQLLIADNKPAKGAQRLEDWIAAGGVPKPRYIEYLWQAWSQAEQYDRALPWAEKWFEAANPKQRKHYDLLNFLHHQLGQYDKQRTIVEKMHTRWPDDPQISKMLNALTR